MNYLISFLKQFAFLSATVFVFFLFFIFFPLRMSREYISSLEKLNLQNKSLFAYSILSERIPASGKNEIQNYLNEYFEASGDSITIYDPRGNVIARSSGISSNFNVHITFPLSNGNIMTGLLGFDHFSPALKSEIENIDSYMTVMMIFSLALIAVVTFLTSKKRTDFNRELLHAMDNIAGGIYNTRIFPSFKGDEKILADSLNKLSETITSSFNELINEKEELQTLISSLSLGIAVLDKKGKIILSNETFKNIFNNPATAGRYYWEVMINAKISDLIAKTQKENRAVSGEVSHLNRYYQANMIFVNKNSETVVVLNDITDSKNLEKIKKDFVDNVSHELKTPLTSIIGFTETLINSEKNHDKKNRLNIILRNSERLNNIVQDLLKISELEETPAIIKPEKINVVSILRNIADLFTVSLKKKNLSLEIKIESELPVIEGDPYKLEQLFVNLIDNAIKYTDAGQISIRAFPEKDNLIIEIEDTGIGIPEEHIPRLFERFYVVDRSRSKDTGGTGLGLSIAKHIVLLHMGRINVQSRPGKGTKFTITLPVSIS
jgi:two-component system phosphate regulon sensor histidine kinase PhoR